jgi:hypothetical protein
MYNQVFIMIRTITITIILLMATSLYAKNPPKPQYAPKRNHISEPVWFCGTHFYGLEISSGSLVYKKNVLIVKPMPERIFAAAYYPDTGIIIIVCRDGTAYHFTLKGKIFVQTVRIIPQRKERVEIVTFTRLHTLCYIFSTDLAIEDEIRRSPERQIYSDLFRKVTFTDEAKKVDAIRRSPDDTLLPGGICIFMGNSVYLELGDSVQLTLDSPDQFARPYREGPGDYFAESIFIFPDKGILCRTTNGWSFFNPDGTFAAFFSTDGITFTWWGKPVIRKGRITVTARSGPQSVEYYFDIPSEKLIEDHSPE